MLCSIAPCSIACGPAVQGAHLASSTPASSSQLASSARHRRLPPHRLFRPYHRLSPSAAPAAREASAPHRSQKTIVMRPLRRAAACARMRAPHRRVDEVADAGHNHARYERLSHQQQNATVKGELLSDDANLVRS
jgi:hypothetical protein